MTTKTVPIVIANWKMNGLISYSMQMLKKLRGLILHDMIGSEIVICPPFTVLRDMAEKIPGTAIQLGAQNCYIGQTGAFTGEISPYMLKELTCSHVILGHSERRHIFFEDSDTIYKKAESAHNAKLKTIICVGETETQRKEGKAFKTVLEQLQGSIPESSNSENTIIAYEPVWSIGTNNIPGDNDIKDMHLYIHKVLTTKMKQFAKDVRVVYGGSVNSDNAGHILSLSGVNGLLVGRASLDAEELWRIIRSAG